MVKYFIILLFTSLTSFGSNLYVDPSAGGSQNGTLANPFHTIAQVNSHMSSLNAGDTCFFKADGRYYGRLSITRSGTSGNEIVFMPYGTGGFPLFQFSSNGSYDGGDVINIFQQNYIKISGIKITDTTQNPTDHTILANTAYAIDLDQSDNCTIINCDISLVGIGIQIDGFASIITNNAFYNLRMVVNTPTPTEDDYGANGIVINSANNIIESNSYLDCWATSFDFGVDGGAIEVFGSGTDDNTIMFNTAGNCNGFMEFGSNTGGTSNNNLIAYNLMVNNGFLVYFNISGTFALDVNNTQFFNNNIVETVSQFTHPANEIAISAFTSTAGIIVLRNNLFWLTSGINVCQAGRFNTGQMTHSNNIFHQTSGSLNFTLAATDTSNSSLIFWTNTTNGNPLVWNYTLLAGSLPIAYGTNVGLTRDFAGNSVPSTPDDGMLQKQSTPPPPSRRKCACGGH